MAEKQVKPDLTLSQASQMVSKLYGLTASQIRPLPSYDDQNFLVRSADGDKFVLKIMNSEDSKNGHLIEMQTFAMSFLHQNGLPSQTAVPSVTGELMTLEEADCGYGPQKYMVRLLTYLPGVTISKVPLTPRLLFEVGKMAAKMDLVLQKMEHPHLGVLQREKFIWSLSNTAMLDAYMAVLDGDPLQQIVLAVIEQFKSFVAPKYPDFRKCINHGDFNDLNMLVRSDEANGDAVISGILDFGDMNSGYFIHELAITIMYMMIEHQRPEEVGGPVLAGWESVFPLTQAEKDCLYVLVLCRFCQSLVLARYSVSLHPENEEYLMITSRKGVHILKQLWEMGKEQVEKIWFQGAAQISGTKCGQSPPPQNVVLKWC